MTTHHEIEIVSFPTGGARIPNDKRELHMRRVDKLTFKYTEGKKGKVKVSFHGTHGGVAAPFGHKHIWVSRRGMFLDGGLNRPIDSLEPTAYTDGTHNQYGVSFDNTFLEKLGKLFGGREGIEIVTPPVIIIETGEPLSTSTSDSTRTTE